MQQENNIQNQQDIKPKETKKSKAPAIITAIACTFGLAGIGFGVFELLQPKEPAKQVTDIAIEQKPDNENPDGEKTQNEQQDYTKSEEFQILLSSLIKPYTKSFCNSEVFDFEFDENSKLFLAFVNNDAQNRSNSIGLFVDSSWMEKEYKQLFGSDESLPKHDAILKYLDKNLSPSTWLEYKRDNGEYFVFPSAGCGGVGCDEKYGVKDGYYEGDNLIVVVEKTYDCTGFPDGTGYSEYYKMTFKADDDHYVLKDLKQVEM